MNHAPLLCLALALLACRPQPVPRGTTVPFGELQSRQAALGALVDSLAQSGDERQAFFAAEVEKTRALQPTPDDQNVEPAAVVARLQQSAGSSRGLTLVSDESTVALAPPSVAVSSNRAYFERLELDEARARAVEQRAFPPGLTTDVRTSVATIEEVGRLLTKEEVVISYFVAQGAIYGTAITQARTTSKRLGDAISIGQDVEQFVRSVRSPRSAVSPESAQALYATLLAPFAPALQGKKNVLISPHGVLANLPFSVLREPGGKMLLSTKSIRYLSAVSQYRASILKQELRRAPRMLVIANPAVSAPWTRLPAAELEGRTLARVFGQSKLLVGSDANELELLRSYRDYDILHFASHGLLIRDPTSASSLVLTPTAESDGYLSVQEIAKLDLSHVRLATLSACETSVNGSQKLDSIASAFLRAGVPSVIGSQWQVPDEATAALMLRFYEGYVRLGAAEALRAAQLSIEQSQAWSHPYYWAGFAYFGGAL